MSDKKPKIYLKDVDQNDKPPNPLIWVAFILIPILVGFVISAVRGG